MNGKGKIPLISPHTQQWFLLKDWFEYLTYIGTGVSILQAIFNFFLWKTLYEQGKPTTEGDIYQDLKKMVKA